MLLGFIDVYGYLLGLGVNFLEVNLCDSKSVKYVVSMVVDYVFVNII